MGFVRNNQQTAKPAQQQAPAQQEAPKAQAQAPATPQTQVKAKGDKPDFIAKVKNAEGKLERIGSVWWHRNKETGEKNGALDVVIDPGVAFESSEADRVKFTIWPNDFDQRFPKGGKRY